MKIDITERQKNNLFAAISVADRQMRAEWDKLRFANIPYAVREEMEKLLATAIDDNGALIRLLSK